MIAAQEPFEYSSILQPKNRKILKTDSMINKAKDEDSAIMLTAKAAL